MLGIAHQGTHVYIGAQAIAVFVILRVTRTGIAAIGRAVSILVLRIIEAGATAFRAEIRAVFTVFAALAWACVVGRSASIRLASEAAVLPIRCVGRKDRPVASGVQR